MTTDSPLRHLQDKSVCTANASINNGRHSVFYTDTVIIGNGPSGLALSAFLSGWRPYYDLHSPHPNRQIHQYLSQHPDISLIDQDLSWITSGDEVPMFLSGGGGGSSPFPHFYDSLVRPDADINHDHPSSLRWELNTNKALPHVVIGQGSPGGSWDTFSPNVYTVSLSQWMDLPGLSMEQWSRGESPVPRPKGPPSSHTTTPEEYTSAEDEYIQRETTHANNVLFSPRGRVPCDTVQSYFRQYPSLAGIDQHQLPYTVVTSVILVPNDQSCVGGPVLEPQVPGVEYGSCLELDMSFLSVSSDVSSSTSSNSSVSGLSPIPPPMNTTSSTDSNTLDIHSPASTFPPDSGPRPTSGLDQRQTEPDLSGGYSWHVIGYHSTEGPVHFLAKNVVLATGVSIPKELGVPKETGSRFILHSLRKLELVLERDPSFAKFHQDSYLTTGLGLSTRHPEPDASFASASENPSPVLVVGSGLSAADVVVHCLLREIPVIHVFRSTKKEIRNTLLGRLGGSAYPDYQALTQLMTGRAKDPNYRSWPRSEVLEFDLVDHNGESIYDINSDEFRHPVGGKAKFRNIPEDSVSEVGFSYAVICIGFQAGLSEFFPEGQALARNTNKTPDSKQNTLVVDPVSYRCRNDEKLHAIGPLVGDNFVRYLVGGAFAVARDIIQTQSSD